MKQSTQEYQDIELNTEVMTASNHKLIQLLIDKCLSEMNLAQIYMETKDVQKKLKSISKAMDIIGYLRMCLRFDDKNAHDMATLLDSIYDYLERTLLQANMTNDVKFLDEARKILMNVKSGWDGISETTHEPESEVK